MTKLLLIATAALAAANAASAADENPTAWKSTAGISVAIARGNARSTLVGGNILTSKKWDRNEISAGLNGAYGDADGNKNVENLGIFGQYNRLITDRWYFGGRVDGMTDTIAGIDYRATISPTLGYYVIKKTDTTLAFEAGPSLILENLKSRNSEQYLALRLAEKFHHKFNEHVTLDQYAEILPRVDKFDDFVVNAWATLSAKLSGNLSSTITLKNQYRSRPAQDRLKNDIQLLAGVSYSF